MLQRVLSCCKWQKLHVNLKWEINHWFFQFKLARAHSKRIKREKNVSFQWLFMCINFDSMRINESSCKCRLQTILTYQSAQDVFKGLLFPWLTSIALALIVHLYKDCRHIWYDSLVECGWFWYGLVWFAQRKMPTSQCQQFNECDDDPKPYEQFYLSRDRMEYSMVTMKKWRWWRK